MTSGRKPAGAIRDAKKFAISMGYRWKENESEDLGYDLFIFKPKSARLVKVRVMRYHVNLDAFYEDLLPDEIRAMRDLPFPKGVPSDLTADPARADLPPARGALRGDWRDRVLSRTGT